MKNRNIVPENKNDTETRKTEYLILEEERNFQRFQNVFRMQKKEETL